MLPVEPGLAAIRRRQAIALGALGLGASAVVFVALPYKVFDLDRYFVPKELALHLTALGAGLAVLAVLGRDRERGRPVVVPLTRVDTLLVAFLVLSVVSACFATNGWLAARALALSVSGTVVFWTAQALSRAGRARTLLAVLGAATTVLPSRRCCKRTASNPSCSVSIGRPVGHSAIGILWLTSRPSALPR